MRADEPTVTKIVNDSKWNGQPAALRVRPEVAVSLSGGSSRAARTPPAFQRAERTTSGAWQKALRRCPRRYGSQREPFHHLTATSGRTAAHTDRWNNPAAVANAPAPETKLTPST